MPESTSAPIETTDETLAERVANAAPGLVPLLAQAEEVWRTRAEVGGVTGTDARPGWRSFEDAFPTFYQFTNRPR